MPKNIDTSINKSIVNRSISGLVNVLNREVAQKIDKEIRKLVDEGYKQATKILTEKIDDLHKIAKALITYETLTGEEIENIINKNIYPKDKLIENKLLVTTAPDGFLKCIKH